MTVQRHPYADHPAALVLADHRAGRGHWGPTAPVRCDCGGAVPDCDYPAHLAEVLDHAGLLAPNLPADAVRAWLNPADVEARLDAPARPGAETQVTWGASGMPAPTGLTTDQGARPVDSNPEFDWPGDDEPDLAPTPPRDVLVKVLVYHWRKDSGGGCGCGWNILGASWPEHVADIYEDSLRARAM